MTSAKPRPRREVPQVDRDIVEQVLRDYSALRCSDTDPELGAVRAAILIEDVFDITLSDPEIDSAVLADVPAMATLIARRRGAI
jgi:hypothetical protein